MVRSEKWWVGPVAKVRERIVWIWTRRVGKVPVGPVLLIVILLTLFFIFRLGKQGAPDSRPPLPSLSDSISDSASEALRDPAGAMAHKLMEEANTRFTYLDGPIHPFGVRELMESVTDEYPGPVAVDLAGVNGGYRYPTTPSRDDNGGVTAQNPTRNECLDLDAEIDPANDPGEGYFTYRRLGALPNGWHVLRVGDNGGGPSLFESLLLVRFRVDSEYGETGRFRVLMERRGMIRLGDRYEGHIRIHGDSISLTADVSSGSRQEDATFGFPPVDD